MSATDIPVGEAAAPARSRVPPGMDAGRAQDALVAHLEAAAPWSVRVLVKREAAGEPFLAEQGGPVYPAIAASLDAAYGRPMTGRRDGAGSTRCATVTFARLVAETLAHADHLWQDASGLS